MHGRVNDLGVVGRSVLRLGLDAALTGRPPSDTTCKLSKKH